jgi:hypothetical protein
MNLEVFVDTPSDGCPATANLLNLDASLAISTRVLHFEVSGLVITHRSDRSDAAAPPPSIFGLGFLDQLRNPVVF